MATTNIGFGLDTDASTVAEAFASQCKDKIILITGVNAGGIGGATAITLATQAPRLLLLSGRTRHKVDEVIQKIDSTYPAVACRFLNLDLSSQKSCRAAAEEVLADEEIPWIDIVINNAGVMDIPELTLSPEGIEMQFATNHVGHYLFTNLIMPKIVIASRKNAKGSTRIVNVSSSGTRYSPIRFSDFNFDRFTARQIVESEKPNLGAIAQFRALPSETAIYIPPVAYGQSKTANVLFSVALNQALYDKYGILSLALHPGAIITELMRNGKDFTGDREELKEKFSKLGITFKTLSQGASTQLVAALDPKLARVGTDAESVFLSDCQISMQRPAWCVDQAAATRLWAVSEELVNEKFSW